MKREKEKKEHGNRTYIVFEKFDKSTLEISSVGLGAIEKKSLVKCAAMDVSVRV